MHELMNRLGIENINSGATTGGTEGWLTSNGSPLVSVSPTDGRPIAAVAPATATDYEIVVRQALAAFVHWRSRPAPERGQVVRAIGERLRDYKKPLGKLISLEMGKILAEGEGEVQEMIDMADFAVGLSRQLYGLTMASERPRHRMYEQWHPLGPVGIITAFNFPVAVWSWNAFIAAVCGDVCIWKPSSKTPLTAIAVQHIIAPVIDYYGLSGVFNMVIGSGAQIGASLVNDTRIPVLSATGSCAMGRRVGEAVAHRHGRSLLELGGNNGVIICEDADLDLAVPAVLFGAVGTAGQRCTSTRRVIVHRAIQARFMEALVKAYRQVPIGDPLDADILMGPLIDAHAVANMTAALAAARSQGGEVIYGGNPIAGLSRGFFMEPAIVHIAPDAAVVQEETFAPILYVSKYETLAEAIQIHNAVPQGLSSAIFTDSLRKAEEFLSCLGSDCGIVGVNVGTSGAEIGGAFGGEKNTGGGREAGSDAWKNYMRRQTCTINWGRELPLSQGIKFAA